MRIISDQLIRNLNISPVTCVEWVKDSFSLKGNAILPPKVSLHPQGIDFFTTMPCIINTKKGSKYFGCKIVHRLTGAVPSLGSDLFLYDAISGELLAIMDSDWITAMRTGAVATIAAQTFRKRDTQTYGFLGLGNTARATLLCLLESEIDIHHKVKLLKYKDQADLFVDRFKNYDSIEFSICNTIEELVAECDVVISCITETDKVLCPDDSLFKKGCLVIPVHTRGFQNCDLFFDKVFADDTGHVRGFKYFDKFKQFAEISDVLCNICKGRENEDERIISYNVGLGLHDVVFGTKIYEMLETNIVPELEYVKETDKFWV